MQYQNDRIIQKKRKKKFWVCVSITQIQLNKRFFITLPLALTIADAVFYWVSSFESHATILTRLTVSWHSSLLKTASCKMNVQTLSQNLYVWRCPCSTNAQVSTWITNNSVFNISGHSTRLKQKTTGTHNVMQEPTIQKKKFFPIQLLFLTCYKGSKW